MPRYEFVEGTSSKFWEITLEGKSFTTTYGKIGTEGQSKTKDWPDAATAKKEHDKLVAEKTKKGYALVGGGKPEPKAEKPAKAAKPTKAAPAPAASAPASTGGALRFELVEGTSSKFWEMMLEGKSFTTRFGKIGTEGQSTTKSFDTEADARKEHDKLVAEKTKKGYAQAGGGSGAGGGGGAAHAHAGTAFRLGDLEKLNGGADNAETFMGQKIVEFASDDDDDGGDDEEGGAGIKDAARRAYRISGDYETSAEDLVEKLEKLANDKNASKLKALVIGNSEHASRDGNAKPIVDALVAVKGKLTSLAALLVNDISSEEAEISWQCFSDVSPILAAYPNLQHLRVRGGMGGKLRQLKSPSLRSLQFEGTNSSRAQIQQVVKADLPALEYLELWLGPEGDYAEEKPLDDLVPILSGKLFPKLKHLGLRNSKQANELARLVAGSPIVDRLETLDLSLGNLIDSGAEALIASPGVAKLKELDIEHHFISEAVLKKLKALKVSIKGSRAEYDDAETDPDFDENDENARYTAVAE